MGLNSPDKITDNKYRFDSFFDGEILFNKKKNHLPAMGWNSWNAFGTGNNEQLTKLMADKIVELGLDKLGYKYVILDDGCYRSKRVDGKLESDEVKFPGGFMAMSDYIHSKGLKFGMYNDIGDRLCSGLEVGTCGHEKTDAQSYINWKIDYLKVDNCYNLWDNATFSNPENAKYVFAPNIKNIKFLDKSLETVKFDLSVTGNGVQKKDDYFTHIGTFDGTNTGTSPNGLRSGELEFSVDVQTAGKYQLVITYATGKEEGIGSWLTLAVGKGKDAVYFYDDLLPQTETPQTFIDSEPITVELKKGQNIIRIMNHRRQENTLCSYAAMLEGLKLASPDNDIILSLCEWGKTHPHNWGYKVADSWRILNDITFRVGSDGDPGFGSWTDKGTPSVTSQYNKAVVMDEYAGLEKGWNDPDMLMIGMTGLTLTMNQTHFAMWCMLNSPLLLGLDLRRVQKNDELYNIITNQDLICLNQDALGIQAKRVYTSTLSKNPDTEYIENNSRFDVLIKPLSDDSIALSLFNLDENKETEPFTVKKELLTKLQHKIPASFMNAKSYTVKNLWTKESQVAEGFEITIPSVEPCGNYTVKISPNK